MSRRPPGSTLTDTLSLHSALPIWLIGIAWAWLVTAPLLLLLSARLTAPRLGLSLWQIARAMLPGLAPALVMAVGVCLADQELLALLGLAAPLPLALLVPLGALPYGALPCLLEPDRISDVMPPILRCECTSPSMGMLPRILARSCPA